MNKFLIDENVDPEEELLRLFDHNGIHYRCEVDGIYAVFQHDGCKWEAVFRFVEHTVLVYGLYPFRVADETRVTNVINGINAKLTRGGMFLQEGNIVMRTSADLFDAYSAYEAIARAVEYNAGAMSAFFHTLAGL